MLLELIGLMVAAAILLETFSQIKNAHDPSNRER